MKKNFTLCFVVCNRRHSGHVGLPLTITKSFISFVWDILWSHRVNISLNVVLKQSYWNSTTVLHCRRLPAPFQVPWLLQVLLSWTTTQGVWRGKKVFRDHVARVYLQILQIIIWWSSTIQYFLYRRLETIMIFVWMCPP